MIEGHQVNFPLLARVKCWLPVAYYLLDSYTFSLKSGNPYPRSSSKRDFIRHDVPPRSKAATDYDSRVPERRRSSYQDDYFSPGSSDYTSVRSSSGTAARRSYGDEGYGRRFEKFPSTYQEGHSRDYDSISGSKRSYSTIVSRFKQFSAPYSLFLGC